MVVISLILALCRSIIISKGGLNYIWPTKESSEEVSKARRFFDGWLFYIIMVSEIVPVVFMFVMHVARSRFRQQLVQDSTINPLALQKNDKGENEFQSPHYVENFGKVDLVMLDMATITQG